MLRLNSLKGVLSNIIIFVVRLCSIHSLSIFEVYLFLVLEHGLKQVCLFYLFLLLRYYFIFFAQLTPLQFHSLTVTASDNHCFALPYEIHI